MPRGMLHRRELWELDDGAWPVFWSGVQWAIGETHGLIPFRYVALLHPDPVVAQDAAKRLADAEVWLESEDGYVIAGWAGFNSHPDAIAHARWVSRKTSRKGRGDTSSDTSPDTSRKERKGTTRTHLRKNAGTDECDECQRRAGFGSRPCPVHDGER